MISWHAITNHFGDMREPYTALLTLIEVLFYLGLAFNVGRLRGKYKILPPETDGPAEFRRAYRIHMNTLEQLAIHQPVLWLSALSVGDKFAACIGVLWLLGRGFYVRDYLNDPKGRLPGFLVALLANVILFFGALAGVIESF